MELYHYEGTNAIKLSVIDTSNSIIWTDRYDEPGDFEIHNQLDIDLYNTIEIGDFLVYDGSEHSMIVEHKERIKKDDEDDYNMLISGRSLESILDRRIIWRQTVLKGSVQNAIEKLLNENAINPTNPARKLKRLRFKRSTDPNITSLEMESAQFTGDNLLDVITSICKVFGIGFKIGLNASDNLMIFELYAGVDRSIYQDKNPSVEFSNDFDNMKSSQYVLDTAGYKNSALVAGEGEGYDRKTIEVSSNDTDEDRREMYVDARDISTYSENGNHISDTEYNYMLVERGQSKLCENTINEIVDSEVYINALSFVYGRDFFLGDIVSNVSWSIENKRITEVEYISDQNGFSIYPTFVNV